MSVKYPTSKPDEFLTLDIVETIPAFSFVSHLGSICAAGALAAGVTEQELESGEKGAVVTAQTALLKIKKQLAVGDKIASDSTGFGVLATTGNFVNAIALGSGVTNMNIEVELVKFKI